MINKTSKRFITINGYDLSDDEKEMVYYLFEWKYALVTNKKLTKSLFIIHNNIVTRQEKYSLFEINDYVTDDELKKLNNFVIDKFEFHDKNNLHLLVRSTFPFYVSLHDQIINFISLSSKYKKYLEPVDLKRITSFDPKFNFVDKMMSLIKGT